MQLAGKRVLILEDEPVIGFAIEDMLVALGCQVAGMAFHIEDALALLEAQTFDLAVLDVNIHGATSYPVADVLAARGVPFVFATGYGSAERPERFAVVRTLTKPYNFAELRQALEALGA